MLQQWASLAINRMEERTSRHDRDPYPLCRRLGPIIRFRHGLNCRRAAGRLNCRRVAGGRAAGSCAKVVRADQRPLPNTTGARPGNAPGVVAQVLSEVHVRYLRDQSLLKGTASLQPARASAARICRFQGARAQERVCPRTGAFRSIAHDASVRVLHRIGATPPQVHQERIIRQKS